MSTTVDVTAAAGSGGAQEDSPLVRGYNAWAEWRHRGFEDDEESWEQVYEKSSIALDELACYYYAGRSTFLRAWDFREQLEKLGLFQFCESVDYRTSVIASPTLGDIELRYVGRCGGALWDVVACHVCPVCNVERHSPPIIERLDLVAFVRGDDSACGCLPHGR